jgi:transposase
VAFRASKPSAKCAKAILPFFTWWARPRHALGQLEKQFQEVAWQVVREGVEVKLLPENQEVYLLAQSRDRIHKERGMRRRQLKRLWKRLKELQAMTLKRDALLMKLGAARQPSPSAWRLVEIQLPTAKNKQQNQPPAERKLNFALRKDKLREMRRREGRYLLRTNLIQQPAAQTWEFYMQLSQVEGAFKNLKGDLGLRPFFHKKEERIEAHIFVAFLAYCLHVSLARRLKDLAPGLTPRSVLEKFKGMQMLDVHLPTTDGGKLF